MEHTLTVTSPKITANLSEWESWLHYLTAMYAYDKTLDTEIERAWRIVNIKKTLTTGM